MRRLCALLVLAAAAGARADDGDAAGRASVEWTTARGTCYVGERVRIRLRVGYDEEFFRDHGVAMVRRRLDLPVHVRVRLDDLPSASRVPPSPAEDAGAGARQVTIALNDDVVAGVRGPDIVRDGRRHASLDFESFFVFGAPGEVRVEAPTLRFAWASRFEDDLVAGDVPLDRREVTVAGTPLALRVLPLPEGGRPAGFSGAVGRLTVEADASPREIALGESVRLVLRIAGDGDLAGFGTPRLDGVAGLGDFHVLGALDDRGASLRTIAWDLAPVRAGTTEVPSIPFAWFDPEPPPGYRTSRTEAIPIVVRGGAAGASSGTPPPQTREEGAAVPPLLLGALAAVVAGVAVIVLTRVRSRRSPSAPDDAERARARVAARSLVERAPGDADEVTATLVAYLAARLRCPPGAVVSPDLAERLVAAGCPPELAKRTASVLDALTAARYGRSGEDANAALGVRTLVVALEESFEAPPRSR